MTRILILAATLVLWGCAHAPPATSRVALDSLLAFSNPAECEPTEAHAAFLRAMWTGGDEQGFRAGKISAPEPLDRAFGPIQINKYMGYTTVSVLTRGTLFGLPLVQIAQTFPEGGDPGDTTFWFVASLAEVERAAQRVGLPAQAAKTIALPGAGAYDAFIELQTDVGPARHALLTCGYQ